MCVFSSLHQSTFPQLLRPHGQLWHTQGESPLRLQGHLRQVSHLWLLQPQQQLQRAQGDSLLQPQYRLHCQRRPQQTLWGWGSRWSGCQ